ncbi:MAG TPA: ABC transporter permease [Thermoanaerobaculia bacterium]|nr:ABC transporter permease [Thermoanaerobaculia bacterium]
MTWLHRLLRRRQLEEQLEKELSFHLDQHTANLIARGHPPDEARRQAKLALGGREQVKEQCRDARGTRWLEDLLQDFRYALRTLAQRPGFAAVTLCTLALGIGATTVMFTVINGVLLKPLSYPEPERLVTLHSLTEAYGDQWGISYLDFLDCKRTGRSLAPMAAWTYGGGTVSAPGDTEYVDGRQVSSELFSVFGLPLARGRTFLPAEERGGAPPAAIISYGLWQRRYGGSPSAIGKALVFDGTSYTVVGIAPAGFRLDGEADVFTPLGQNTELKMQNRAASFIHVVARLVRGVRLAQAQAELALIGRHLAAQFPQTNAGRGFQAQPLRQELVGDVRSTLWLLLGAVALVLLIVCVNVASLLLARAISRERELAMRVALGAGRGRLVRQCLTESAVLGLLGGLLGVLLAAVGFRPFVLLWPGSLPRAEEVQLDWHVLLFALAAALASGFLFGLAPALRAPASEVEQTLRAGARTVTGGSRHLHSGFVMSEISLAVVLLVAAGILGRTVLRLSSADPGIDIHNVIVAHVALSPGVLQHPARIRAAWQAVLARVRRVPAVQSVALADVIPMREGEAGLGYWTTPVPPLPNQMPIALASSVTPDYLQVMGIPLRRGRFFDDQDRLGSELVVVIDEVLAQHAFPHQDPVGKPLWVQALGPGPVRVVGLVGHVRHWGLASDDRAQLRDQIYYPFGQVPDRSMRLFATFMSMAVRTSIPPLNAVEPLRRQVRGEAADQTFYQVRTMEQLAFASLARQRFLTMLFGIFACLALLLACVGIYGVLAYVTGQRIPEFGLRMALGASARDVLRLVLRQSVRMIFVGVGVGLAIALAAAHLLERLVAGVRSAEPSTFAIMTSVLVAAALLASFLPARRASRVDPMSALRQE